MCEKMKIIITESQLKEVTEVQMIMESIFEVESLSEFKKEVKKLIRRLLLTGVAITTIYSVISNYCDKNNIPENVKQEALATVQEETKKDFDKINEELFTYSSKANQFANKACQNRGS